MTFVRSWAKGLIAASVLSAVCTQLGGRGATKKVMDFVCGILMLSVLLSPMLHADREAFADALSNYRAAAAALTEDAEEREKQLLRTYIEQKCGAYILDEAEAIGAALSEVTVRAVWRGESWIPWEAQLRGTITAEQRAVLGACMESQLGIPPERQRWNEQDGPG